MKRLLPIAALAASLFAPLGASATNPIFFDPAGTGAGFQIDVLDWAPGNALAVGGNPTTGLFTGDTVTLLYQANLGSAIRNGSNVFSNGDGGKTFTIVAGFTENVTGLGFLGSGSGATLGVTLDLASSPTTNFIYIYANSAGNDLAGTGFAGAPGDLIFKAHVSSINSSNFFFSGSCTGSCDADFSDWVPDTDKLDKFNSDNYPGIQTIIGSGSTDLEAVIDFVNPLYFPVMDYSQAAFTFFNTSQVDPYNQTNPSALFSSDGVADGDTANNIGSVNGAPVDGVDRNFQFQVDGNQSFQATPEPGSLALVGLAIAGFGVASSRRRSKQAS